LNADGGYLRRRREAVPALYISTEGVTEKKYFDLLNAQNMGFVMRPFTAKRKNPTGVVETCIDRMSQTNDSADRGVAVFDVDNNTQEDFIEALKLAQINRI